MPSQVRISAAELHRKFEQVPPHLDARRRRLHLASEAVSLGHGGIAPVAAASRISTATIGRAQFAHITATATATATAFLEDGQPVISVDTKAKEWIGNRDRPGRVRRPGKDPIKVDCLSYCVGSRSGLCVLLNWGGAASVHCSRWCHGNWILTHHRLRLHTGPLLDPL
ncbi:hypothetical protein AQI96_36610 [Streptomyces canus]|nr:hypothetical protein AQI96_36610 [Streptomyces canus]